MVDLNYLHDSFPDVRLACECIDDIRSKSLTARFDPKINDENQKLVKSKMFNDDFWNKFNTSNCFYFVEVNGTVNFHSILLEEAVNFYNEVK